MFRAIKLWFKDRNYYNQRKRYLKLQTTFRKELKKQAKDFCPWSGYYMHKMIVTMLDFYYKTYEAQDCCWSESAWTGRIAASLKEVLEVAADLDKIDDLKAFKIARDIKEKIENELTYPGQIKVTVIREVRANEVAK